MTKVKKSKKPKARKARKVIVKKTGVDTVTGARANVVKIDKRLNKAPIIVHEPRSALPQAPLRMFTGQDTGSIISRQLDVLASKEQQLEGKVTELQKKNLYEQIIGKMSIIDNNLNVLDKNYEDKEYDRLNKQLKEINRLIPKDEPTLFDFYDNLYERLRNIKNENKMDVLVEDEELTFLEKPALVEVKSTNTLLDDKIYENDLVDEAQIIIDEIKNTNVKNQIVVPIIEEVKKPRGRPPKIFDKPEPKGLLDKT